jgi:serine/threonine protein kinase
VPLPPATRLGSYEIIAPLGAGGMGEVYRARDTRLKRDIAIKVLPADVASSPERLARFEREATTVCCGQLTLVVGDLRSTRRFRLLRFTPRAARSTPRSTGWNKPSCIATRG